MAKAYISYRRADTCDISVRLYRHLKLKLGKQNVFMDYDTIPLGVDFRSALRDAVAWSDVCIALIGPKWLDDEASFRSQRLADRNDPVRVELEAAFARDVPVIPVLVNGARMPRVDELPMSLVRLPCCCWKELRPGPDFYRDLEELVHALPPASTAEVDSGVRPGPSFQYLAVERRDDVFLATIIGPRPNGTDLIRVRSDLERLAVHEGCEKLVIDLSSLGTLNDGMLNLLMSVLHAVRRNDGRLRLCEIGPLAVRRLLLSGRLYQFEIADDVKSAISDW